jgi:hypothetical protein
MRIAYSNLVDDATITASSEDPMMPADNVKVQRLAKAWRTTAVTGITCVVALDSAQAVDTVAILGHTISTSATVTIEANTTDSWSPAAWSTSLTALDNTILRYLDSAQTYQYWRFTVEDASSASTFIDVGRLWLGEYLQISPASTSNFTVSFERSDTVSYGRGRQKFATQGVGWRSFDLSFRGHHGSMLTAIQTMYATVGNHSSVIFSNFDESRAYPIVEPCYCSIDDAIDFSHIQNMRFDWNLRLTEDR